MRLIAVRKPERLIPFGSVAPAFSGPFAAVVSGWVQSSESFKSAFAYRYSRDGPADNRSCLGQRSIGNFYGVGCAVTAFSAVTDLECKCFTVENVNKRTKIVAPSNGLRSPVA